MTRTRASAKAAGATFERIIADYFAEHLDDRIDRRVKTGAKDKGDIGGVRVHGQRLVIEAKDYGGRLNVGPWLREVDIERQNDGALAGLVIAKRRGIRNPAEQIALATLEDIIAIMTGSRDARS